MKRSIGYFVAASGVVTLGLYLFAHLVVDADRSAFQRDRTTLVARAVAYVAGVERAREDADGATDAFMDRLKAELPGFQRGLVLRRAKYLAHSETAKRRQRLDRDSLADKALYDAAKAMKADVDNNREERRRRPELDADPFPSATFDASEDRLVARVPVTVDGDFEAMAQVELQPDDPPAPFPLVLGVLWLVAVLVFLPVALRLGPTPMMLAGGAILAATTILQVEQLHGWRASLREDRAIHLAETAARLGGAGLRDWARDPTEQAALLSELNRDRYGFDTARLTSVRSSTAAAATSDPNALVAEAAGARATVSQVHLDRLAAEQTSRLDRWAFAIGLLGLAVLILGFLGQLDRFGRALSTYRNAYLYMSPAMLGLLVLVFVPVTYGLALGFQARVYNAYEFVGLKNYAEILSTVDFTDPRNFWFTLSVTVLWTVVNLVFSVSIGLFLALLLNDQMLKAKGIYRVILVVPWAIPNYVTALIWKSMFHKQFGAVNAFLEALGFEGISWFQTFWPSFSTNVATNVWLGFPFMMVVSLGALQSIPTDLYEAARVDGASRWQRFRNITLPLLMPALVPAVIVSTVWTFNMFNIIYLVSGGGPNGATDILITEAYRWAFEADRKGFAAAYSTVIFLILLCFTLVTNRVTGATKGAFE